jgi:hypothetical protein
VFDDVDLQDVLEWLAGPPLRIAEEGIEIPFPQQTVWHRASAAS